MMNTSGRATLRYFCRLTHLPSHLFSPDLSLPSGAVAEAAHLSGDSAVCAER